LILQRAGASKEASGAGETEGSRRNERDSRLWASIHLVSSFRWGDAVLAIENNVFLLGLVSVCAIDLFRDALKFLISYGIAAVGEAL
jgi:hypothetical protein